MDPRRLLWAVVVVAAVIAAVSLRESAGSTTVADAAGCPRSGEFPKREARDATRAAVVCLHNAERAEHGLPPLGVNPALVVAAQRHSDDMAKRKFFAHETPEGVTPAARMAAAGYGGGWRGENLWFGSDFEATPVRAVRGWMESPGHRANLLRGQFTEIGIGIAYESPKAGGDEPAAVYTANFGG